MALSNERVKEALDNARSALGISNDFSLDQAKAYAAIALAEAQNRVAEALWEISKELGKMRTK